MDSNREASVERARAMLEQCSRIGCHRRFEVRVSLSVEEHWSLEKGNGFVEQRVVAGGPQVVRCGVRQPEEVIGYARAHAASGRLVPPMLHVALDELPRRGLDDLRARQIGSRYRERHHVLKLVAKAVRATGLIERRARPDP